MSVLVEEALVVHLVGMRLPERNLPLEHHVGVVSLSIAHGDASLDRRGGGVSSSESLPSRELVGNPTCIWLANG